MKDGGVKVLTGRIIRWQETFAGSLPKELNGASGS